MAGYAQHDVGVALELLHHFLRLQVPYVHLVVLAAGHDILAVRHGERGEDAEVLVLVSRVRLVALARGGIPDLDGAVLRRGEDELTVRREPHKRSALCDSTSRERERERD